MEKFIISFYNWNIFMQTASTFWFLYGLEYTEFKFYIIKQCLWYNLREHGNVIINTDSLYQRFSQMTEWYDNLTHYVTYALLEFPFHHMLLVVRIQLRMLKIVINFLSFVHVSFVDCVDVHNFVNVILWVDERGQILNVKE